MLAHRPRAAVAQAIIEALIVGVVEALVLQRPFKVPVDLGHEAEVRPLVTHSLSSPGPKRLGPNAPGALEDVRQHQHRHVAAHAVALTGDLHEFVSHGVLRRWITIVQLEGVGPAWEKRIAPKRQQHIALGPFDPGIVLWSPRKGKFRPLDEVLRMILNPRVAESHMVRYKIKHQPQAALAKP